MNDGADELGRRIDDLARRIDDLARRIERLELLAIEADDPADNEVIPAALTPTPYQPTPIVDEPIEDAEPSEKRERLERFIHRRETADDVENLPASTADWLVPKKREPRAPRPALNLEQFVGARLFAVVGALVIVVGAALILKVAWDGGWFDVLSDSAKCVTGAAFGLALLGAGEVVRKKISASASIGPTAAGIGVLYSSAFAAYGHFGLISHETGFVLLAATAAIGVFVGVRARLASVSALSIVGAYLVPLFFLDVEPKPAVLPSYLSSILVVGLLLSAMLGGKFTGLRTLVWWGTVVYGTAWATLMGGTDHLWLALSFFAFAWGAIHAELIFSAKRRGLTGADTSSVEMKTWRSVRPIASSFSASAWATLLASVALFTETGESWSVPAALCVVTALMAFLVGGGLRVLREQPATDVDRLAKMFAIEAGALLIAAVALGLAGWLEIVAWLSLGVGAVVGGRVLRARPLDIYGLIVLVLVTLRLAIVEQWMLATTPDDVRWMGMYLTRWSLLTAIDGVVWLIAAGLLLRNSAWRFEWRAVSHACVGVGLSLVFASGFHELTSNLADVWLLLAIAASVFGAGVLLRSVGLRVYSMAAPALSASFLLFISWMDPQSGTRFGEEGADATIVLTSWTPAMLAVFVYWLSVAMLQIRENASAGWAVVAQCCTGVGLFFLYMTADHPVSDSAAVGWIWLLLSVAVYWGHGFVPALWLRRWGIVGAIVAVWPWWLAYVYEGWSANQSASGAHPGLWLALAIAGVLTAMSVRVIRFEAIPMNGWFFGWVGAGVAAGLAFWATTLEVGRIAEAMTDEEMSRRAVISIWWGVYAIGLIGLGFWRRIPIVRHSGLALMALATSKAVLFDLDGVPLAWRAVSFIALGLMMLAVGLVYARVSASVADDRGE